MAVKSPRGLVVHSTPSLPEAGISVIECATIFSSFRRALNQVDTRFDNFNAIIRAKMEIIRLTKMQTIQLKSLGEIALNILKICGRSLPILATDDDILVDEWIEMRYLAAINMVLAM